MGNTIKIHTIIIVIIEIEFALVDTLETPTATGRYQQSTFFNEKV